jgi:hypothetical protein
LAASLKYILNIFFLLSLLYMLWFSFPSQQHSPLIRDSLISNFVIRIKSDLLHCCLEISNVFQWILISTLLIFTSLQWSLNLDLPYV